MEKCKILIVDDEKILLLQTLKELEKTDFQVDAVESAEKAIVMVKKQKYDIIFTDLVLPGKNGVELCSAIKKISPQTEVVLMSGSPNEVEKHIVVFLQLGGREEFLRKPFTENELLDVAVKICNEKK